MMLTARCRCGGVTFEMTGAPIASAVCCCADCQAGSAAIEALPGAGRVRQADAGTAYTLFRKDRVACRSGADRLRPMKLTPTTATNRMVATCCNAAMMITFDKGPHWITVYRDRLGDDPPPLEMRICTKSKPAGAELADDLPNYASIAPGLVFRLVKSKLAMLFGR